MKLITTLLLMFFALTAQAAEIEIYQFWLTNFGYTCRTSKAIIEEVVKEEFPDAKFEIINLDTQSSNTVLPNSYLKKKGVAILNKETGKYKFSQIRFLISQQESREKVKQTFIEEVNSIK